MPTPSTSPTTPAPTINVEFRAVSLNRGEDTARNAKLAYAVQDAFKQSSMIDREGTKLYGTLEQVEGTNTTFGFSMTLKLRNEMRL